MVNLGGLFKGAASKIWSGSKAAGSRLKVAAPVIGGKLNTATSLGAGMLGGVLSTSVVGDFNVFVFFLLASLIHLFDVLTGVQRNTSLGAFMNSEAMIAVAILLVVLFVFLRAMQGMLGEYVNKILVAVILLGIITVLPFRDFMLIIYAVFTAIAWLFLSGGAYDDLKALLVVGVLAYGYPLLSYSLPSVFGSFDWRILLNPVLHPWFVYYGFMRFRDTKSLVKVLAVGFLIFIWVGNLFFWTSTSPEFAEVKKTISEQDLSAVGEATGQAKAGWLSVFRQLGQSVQGMWQSQIQKATGPFGVEQAQAQDVTPYGLEIKESDFFTRKNFPAGGNVIIYASVKKMEGLERQEVKVTDISCRLMDSENNEIQGIPSTTELTLLANDKERDIKCTFTNIANGDYEAVFEATYKSRSEATLQTCFMDLDKMQQLKRDGIEPLTKCKMQTTTLAALHNYPVSLGIGLSRKAPIGLWKADKSSEWCSIEKDLCEAPDIGIRAVIKPEWNANVKEINNLIIQMPNGMTLEMSDDCDFEKIEEPATYSIKSTNRIIEKDRSFFCKTSLVRETILSITPEDPEGAIAVPEQIPVVMNYDLGLKGEIKNIKVGES